MVRTWWRNKSGDERGKGSEFIMRLPIESRVKRLHGFI